MFAFDRGNHRAGLVNDLALFVECPGGGFALIARLFEVALIVGEFLFECVEGLGVALDLVVEFLLAGCRFGEAEGFGFDEVGRVLDGFVGHFPALVCGFGLVLGVGQRVLRLAQDTPDDQPVFLGEIARILGFFEHGLGCLAFAFERCDL